MIGVVAATHFVMQKLFTLQKEKHPHTKHGANFFQKRKNQNKNLIALPFLNFNQCPCHFFLSRFKMVDQIGNCFKIVFLTVKIMNENPECYSDVLVIDLL